MSEWLRSDPARLLAVLAVPRPNPRVSRLVERARRAGVAVETIDPVALQRLSGPRNPQGVAARVQPFPFADLTEVVDAATSAGLSPFVLVVDGVTDPGNLGGILRSAAFFGAAAVVLPRDRSAAISPQVERSAAGAAARVPICQVNSLLRTVEGLQARGFRVVASVLGHHPPPAALDLSGPLVLLLGSEGKGLRPSLRKAADVKCALVSAAGPASLNVSSFAGVLLYEVVRQRSAVT